jgi:hypothetical protein
MICKTTDAREIARFVDGVVDYAINGYYWTNPEMGGIGCLCIGDMTHDDFMDGRELWVEKPSWVAKGAEEVIKEAVRTNGANYTTCTSKGEYSYQNGVLTFEGFRNSFYGGCLAFRAKKEGNWELVESTQSEWGVWDRPGYEHYEEEDIFGEEMEDTSRDRGEW